MREYLEKFRTLYSNPPSRVVTDNFDPSLTQQHFKDECDINNIMRRYRETGYLVDPLVQAKATAKPMFGDFSTAYDFHEAQNTIARANEAFAALPSVVRERFANDPARMLAFIEDERNVDEAVKLGLLEKRPSVVDQVVVPPADQQVNTEGIATS